MRRSTTTCITAGTAEVLRAAAADDPATALAVYDDVVASVVPLWHEWFQAARAGGVDQLISDGGRVIDFYSPYEASRGPEYRMWVARRAAEHLRWLVAEGRSNGELGKQLFISTKTVSVHVSNILAKLDAASRTEAAAVARRRGLL